MTGPWLIRYALLALLASAACTRASAPPSGAAAAPPPTSAAVNPPRDTTPQGPAPVVTPPSPPDPAPIPLRSAMAIVDSTEIALDPAGTVTVEPRATFRIEVAAVVADGRLSVRDGQDAMVPSSGTTEVGDSWTRFQLAPDAPLTPGTRYTLHLDGNATLAPHDGAGQAFRPLVLAIRTAGDRPLARVRKRRASR